MTSPHPFVVTRPLDIGALWCELDEAILVRPYGGGYCCARCGEAVYFEPGRDRDRNLIEVGMSPSAPIRAIHAQSYWRRRSRDEVYLLPSSVIAYGSKSRENR